MTPQEQSVRERLERVGVPFERYEHPAVATADAARAHWDGIDAVHCKNLFLRNQKGDRHYLVIIEYTKRADLRAVAAQIGDGKLSFASAERLFARLGVAPGSVSLFGLIHDPDRHVRVFLDRDLKTDGRISFHPNDNTATYVLAFADVERFLADTGHALQYLTV